MKILTPILFRFIVAGGLNTLFGFTVYYITSNGGFAVWQSLIVSMLVGVCFNFATTGVYVFKVMCLNRFYRFLAVYFAIYTVNLALLNLLSQWISNHIFAQGVLSIPIAFVSYCLMYRFVFSQSTR